MTQSAYKTCGNCQQTLPADAVFCNRCGTQFTQQNQQLTPQYQQPQPQYPQPQYQQPQYQQPQPQYQQPQPQYPQQPQYQQPANIVVNVAQVGSQQPYVAQKSKIAAALLAFFLGGFGIHGFYIGNTGMGIAFLVATLISYVLVFAFGLGLLFLLVIGLVCIIQTILFLVASDYDFDQKYVVQKRWF